MTLKFESSRYRDICSTIDSQRGHGSASGPAVQRSTSVNPCSHPLTNPNRLFKRSISSPPCVQQVRHGPLPPIPLPSSFTSLEDICVSSYTSLTSMKLKTYEDCDTLYRNILPGLHLDCAERHVSRSSTENLSSGPGPAHAPAPSSPGSDTGSHFSWDIESYAKLATVLQTFRMAQQLEEQQHQVEHQWQQGQEISLEEPESI